MLALPPPDYQVVAPEEAVSKNAVRPKPAYPHPDVPREDIKRMLTVSKTNYLRAMLKTTQEMRWAKGKHGPSA